MSTELQQFDKLKAEVSAFVQPTFAIKVSDKNSSDNAMDAARQVKSFFKRVEDRRKELVGPLNDRVKEINEFAKKITEPLRLSENHLKNELAGFERVLEKERQEKIRAAEEEKRRKEEELRAQSAASKTDEDDFASMFKSSDDHKREEIEQQVAQERGEFEINKDHQKAVKAIETQKVSGARRIWKFEVTHDGDVPREFLSVDEIKIRKAIAGGLREIPGVRIFEDVSIAVR